MRITTQIGRSAIRHLANQPDCFTIFKTSFSNPFQSKSIPILPIPIPIPILMATSNKKKQPDFEQALESLEKITDVLEQGDLNLADAMRAYEDGLNLSMECRKMLEAAERRLEVLENTKDDEWEKRELDWDEMTEETAEQVQNPRSAQNPRAAERTPNAQNASSPQNAQNLQNSKKMLDKNPKEKQFDTKGRGEQFHDQSAPQSTNSEDSLFS